MRVRIIELKNNREMRLECGLVEKTKAKQCYLKGLCKKRMCACHVTFVLGEGVR